MESLPLLLMLLGDTFSATMRKKEKNMRKRGSPTLSSDEGGVKMSGVEGVYVEEKYLVL